MPAMRGRGLKEDVISEVGPIIIESTQQALYKVQEGKSLSEAGKQFAQDIKRGVKHKVPSIATQLVKRADKRKLKGTF